MAGVVPGEENLGLADDEVGGLALAELLLLDGLASEDAGVGDDGVVPEEVVLGGGLVEEEVGDLAVEGLAVVADGEVLDLEERHVLLGVGVVELERGLGLLEDLLGEDGELDDVVALGLELGLVVLREDLAVVDEVDDELVLLLRVQRRLRRVRDGDLPRCWRS